MVRILERVASYESRCIHIVATIVSLENVNFNSEFFLVFLMHHPGAGFFFYLFFGKPVDCLPFILLIKKSRKELLHYE